MHFNTFHLAWQERCQRSGELWRDPEFEASGAAGGHEVQWVRPHELCPAPRLVVAGAGRLDVVQGRLYCICTVLYCTVLYCTVQGRLGDCWLLAAVAALATRPELLEAVLVPGQSLDPASPQYTGAIRFRLWVLGAWCEVTVDDLLPSLGGSLAFLHSAAASEFWSALLEKAVAKLHGGYSALRGGAATEAMVDLTGGTAEVLSLGPGLGEAALVRALATAHTRRALSCCSIQPDPAVPEARTGLGLVRGHAYTVTGVARARLEGGAGAELVRVRNPWGGGAEWRGAWCDGRAGTVTLASL